LVNNFILSISEGYPEIYWLKIKMLSGLQPARYGIDVDGPTNGVFLPIRFNTDVSMPRISYKGKHPNSYSESVNDS